MTNLKALLEEYGTANSEENAVEALVVSVQLALQRVMSANCVTQKELAERLGLSGARVSQILSADGANLTLKTIARVALALGDEFEFVSRSDAAKIYEAKVERIADVARQDAEDFVIRVPMKRAVGASRNFTWLSEANQNASPMETDLPTRMVA